MKKIFWAAPMALVLALAAYGATKGDLPSKVTFGAVQVLTASATKVFTGMPGRNAFSLYNNGPNTLWCGNRSSVTTSTGFPVPAGASLSIDLAYHDSGDSDFYCIASTADQASPADTRWLQVK